MRPPSSAFVLDEDEEQIEQPERWDDVVSSFEANPLIDPHPAPLNIAETEPQQVLPLHTTAEVAPLPAPAAVHRSTSLPDPELPASTLADCVQQIQENQQCIAETEQLLQDLLLRSTSLANAQKVLEQHTVLAALTSAGHTFGCHSGRPVAALLLHRCCLHWRTFETPEGAPLLEQLLALIAGQAADDQEQQTGRSEQQDVGVDEALSPGAARLAYWLATSSTLLAMVTKLVPPPSTACRTSHPGSSTASSTHPAHLPPTPLSKLGAEMSQFQKKVAGSWRAGWARSLMSKMGSGSSSGSTSSTIMAKPDSHDQQQHAGVQEAAHTSGEGVHASTPIERMGSGASAASEQPQQQQQQVPSVPVHVFRQQLALLTLRLYGLLRDHFKKQLASLLPACVQATSGALAGSDTASAAGSPLMSPRQGQLQGQLSTISNGSTVQAVAAAGATAKLQHWAELVALLSHGLRMLQDQGVPRIMCKCLMKQVLAFVDVQMFNQLLLRPECCSASNTHTMAEGLKFLDAWLAAQADNEETSYLVALQADLSHVRQALLFLVHTDKGSLSLQDIVHMCPALSLQQLYRLCTTFWDDTPQPAPASPPKAAHPLQQQQQQQQQAAAPGVSAAAGLPQSGQLAQQEYRQQQPTHLPLRAAAPAGLPQHEALAQQEHDQLAGSEPLGSMQGEGSADDSSAMEQEEGYAWAGHGAAAGACGEATAAAAAVSAHGEGMEELAAAAVLVGRQSLEMYVPASSGMVSGEVLEELKGQPQVLSNGGLIVTFLLDEEQEPVIAAPRGSAAAASCAIAYEVLALIDDTLDVSGGRGHAPGEDAGRGRLYAGMPVPSQLLQGGTPKEPFLFLEKDVCY